MRDAGFADERTVEEWNTDKDFQTMNSLREAQKQNEPVRDVESTLTWSLLSPLALGSLTSVAGPSAGPPSATRPAADRHLQTRPGLVLEAARTVGAMLRIASKAWFQYSKAETSNGRSR